MHVSHGLCRRRGVGQEACRPECSLARESLRVAHATLLCHAVPMPMPFMPIAPRCLSPPASPPTNRDLKEATSSVFFHRFIVLIV